MVSRPENAYPKFRLTMSFNLKHHAEYHAESRTVAIEQKDLNPVQNRISINKVDYKVKPRLQDLTKERIAR